MIKRLFIITIAALSLGGCSVFGGSHRHVAKPAVLHPIKHRSMQARVLWRHGVGDGTHGLRFGGLRLAAADGVVYAMDPSGLISAFRANGKVLWRHQTRLKLSGGPGVVGDTVVVGSLSGTVLALDRKTGKPLWRQTVSSEVLVPPVGANGITVVRSGDGRFFAFGTQSGKRLWNHDTTVPRLSVRGESVPVIGGGLVIAGADNGKLIALSLNTGQLAWSQTVQLPTGRTEIERLVDVDGDVAVGGGDVFAASYGGEVAGVSVAGGQLLWKRQIASDRGVAVDQGVVYVTSRHGEVLAIDANTGNTLWKQDGLHDRGVTQPVVDGPWIVVADRFGYLHWLSPGNGHIVGRIEADGHGIEAPPLVMGNKVFTLSTDGRVSAFAVKPTGGSGS